MRLDRLFVTAVLVVTAFCQVAGATGLMVPKGEDIPCLAIKSHRVAVKVTDGVATTTVTEVFINSTKRRLEATYVFPVPKEAAITDFAMFINGKRQGGEVVEADKARGIYEDIVRRMRDPGLLEYMDSRLLKMRVFPIEPESTHKVEVTYTYPLPFDNGVYRFTFPLKTGEKASKVIEDSTLSVDISSRKAIANVYSPTHRISITRKDDHHVIAGFEEEGAMLDKDFLLYFSVADKDFGLNLITHRPKGQDGYFALMLAPRTGIADDDVMPKDVCFLLDVSGSMMQQNRMESAKEAVKFCLKALGEKDRFALVTFSTGTDAFGGGLIEATAKNVEEATAHVDALEARGGTALSGALAEGLKTAPDGERPYIVVLITDGKPTIGTVEPDEILDEVKAANKKNVRVFSFGIAENLDVPLLDSITQVTRGHSEYVAPGREIETEISAFFRKVSHPVLSGLKIDFGPVKVRDVYPQQVPDLFRGAQVMLFGRYSGEGDVAVQLTGTMKGKERNFAYDAAFPAQQDESAFITDLWAQRKIAYLLDEIRLHGENKELVDEVVRLSKEYAIATPYTAYLVLEDEDAYRRHGIVRGDAALGGVRLARPTAMEAGEDAAFGAERRREAETLTRAADSLGATGGKAEGERSGRDAVALSEAMSDWKDSGVTGEAGMARVPATLKKVGEKTFVRIRGVYVDTEFTEALKTLKVKWGSDAYFAALRALPDLTPYLALGENVVVVLDGKALIVGEEGEEELGEEAVREFFAE